MRRAPAGARVMLSRPLAAALLAAAVLGGLAASPTGSAAPTTGTLADVTPSPGGTPAVTFLFSGHGWGHGLGLSQWGARGFALRGWSYDRILARYYKGTTLGSAPVSKVRVLLAGPTATLKLGSSGGWAVVDGDGAEHALDPGTLTLGKALRLKASGEAGPAALPEPLTFVPRGAPVELARKAYRGSVEVTKTPAGKLQAVNAVGLEDYLRGVVPSEMPSTWPAEALKAQAVAARSYALAQRLSNKPYDLFADVRSQVYGGIAAESAAASTAIDATAGSVVLYDGAVADTMFSSSSGGRTAAASEAFAGKPIPYLVSVADPYDDSPYRNWGPVAVDGSRAAKALGLRGPLEAISTVTGPSGRITKATLTGRAETTKDVSGGDLRVALGLRSTWVETIGLLSLRAAAATLPYGSATTLQGLVRSAPAPQLEQRAAGGPWAPGPALSLAADGSFTLAVKPAVTTQYRLVAGEIRGSAARLPVAPQVTLRAGLAGTVKPVALGATVELQIQNGTTWLTVASVPVDAAGAFAAGDLGPGTYRARYAPGGGLVPGLSPPLVLP